MRYLQLNEDNALRFTPEARPLSATLAFVGPSGATVSSPSVTLDNLAATLASVGDFSFVVSGVTGAFVAGRQYWLISATGPAFLITVSGVSGTTVSYEDRPAGTIAAADTIVGASLAATVLAANVAATGINNQLRWAVTYAGGGVKVFTESAAICRTVFNPPMTAAKAARHAGYAFPGVTANRPAEYWDAVAARASRRVETRIISSGKMPHLIGDQSLLEDAGFVSLRIELARDGLIPQGFSADGFLQSMEDDLRTQLEFALSNVWHDDDQDGAVTVDELRSPKSVHLVRV